MLLPAPWFISAPQSWGYGTPGLREYWLHDLPPDAARNPRARERSDEADRKQRLRTSDSRACWTALATLIARPPSNKNASGSPFLAPLRELARPVRSALTATGSTSATGPYDLPDSANGLGTLQASPCLLARAPHGPRFQPSPWIGKVNFFVWVNGREWPTARRQSGLHHRCRADPGTQPRRPTRQRRSRAIPPPRSLRCPPVSSRTPETLETADQLALSLG